MFAGSCIGVIGLVIALEFLRRVQREYNRLINRQDDDAATAALVAGRASTTSVDEHNPAKVPHANVATILSHDLPTTRVQADRMTLLRRQLVRALLHMMQFGVAYIIMLIAMSFNGEYSSEDESFCFQLTLGDRIHHHLYSYRRLPRIIYF